MKRTVIEYLKANRAMVITTTDCVTMKSLIDFVDPKGALEAWAKDGVPCSV